MEILINDVIRYKNDNWLYIIRDIKTNYKEDNQNGILYECVSPNESESNTMVWCHTLKDLRKAIENGDVYIFKIGAPSKKIPKFNFI